MNNEPHTKKGALKKKKFFCPLGYQIMWHCGLEYKECPLFSPYRDMPECKDCKYKIDKEWKPKEKWQDVPVKKKKKPRHKKKRGARR